MHTSVTPDFRNSLDDSWDDSWDELHAYFLGPLPDREESNSLFPTGSPLHLVAAKLRLESAKTPVQRQDAIGVAMALGMPLSEIQEYLDWLDVVRVYESDVRAKPRYGAAAQNWIAQPMRVFAQYIQQTHRRLVHSARPILASHGRQNVSNESSPIAPGSNKP
jgi:hypothetical protein